MHKQKLWRGLVLGSLIALIVGVFTSTQAGPLPPRRLTAPNGPGGKATGGMPDAKPYGVEVVSAEAFGTIQSLADVPDVPRSPRPSDDDAAVLPKYQQNGPASFQIDSMLQTKPGALENLGNPIANFAGMGITEAGGFLPPDTQGDIGYDSSTGRRYYFQWVNVTYKVWDVTNPAAPSVVIPTTQGNALWSAALPGSECALRNHGDPITLFDEQAGRWMISQFALGVSYTGPFHQCIAVSQTANPAGAWNVYDFPYRNATTYMNDYPHFGVWPDAAYNAYYMTVHQFSAGGSWLGQAAAAYDRAKILAGDPTAQAVYFDLYSVNSNFGGMLPADLDGTPPPTGTPGLFFEVDDNTAGMGADALRVWELRPNWTTPASSTFGISGQPNYTVTVASFNLLPCTTGGTRTCIPQPGTSQKLDAIGDRLMYRAAFRTVGSTQSVMLNHTVWADGTDRAGVRWYEARRNPADGSWSIYQQGTYAPADGQYRWMGSVAMDSTGNIALGYSASSSTVSSTIRYAGRVVSDSLNTLPQTEITMATSAGSQTHIKARWGDYSMMGVDPVDGCTFWYTQEYHGATASSAWQTRIGSFKFAECAPVSTGNLSGTVRNAANSNPIAAATVTAISSSGGSYPGLTDGSGRYQIISLPIGTYTVTASATGYNPAQATGVNVTTGVTTTQDLALSALPQADLSLIKTASASILAPSSTLAYTLTVTNNGPDAITTTVTVTDVLPSGYGLGTAAGAGWSCSGTTTVVCTRTGLVVGASASINLTGTAPAALGSIVNTATVNSNVADLILANNTSAVSGMITPSTDLALTKTGPAFAAPGATLVYTLNVTNNGPLAIGQTTQTVTNAAPITIVDNNAASLYPSPIIIAGGGAVHKATANILGITHTFPSDVDIILVSPSGAKSWLMSDVIGSIDIANLDLSFDDTAATGIACAAVPTAGTYKPTDCADSIGTDVFPAPAPIGPYTANLAQFNNTDPTGTWNLYVRDDTGSDSGKIGGWSLTLLTGYAGPITVTDALPAGTTYVGATGNGWNCAQAGGVVTCTRTTLAPGTAPAIVITATAPVATGVITNTAAVESGLSDNAPANNAAQFMTSIINGEPVYGVALTPGTAGQSGLAGTSVTYTLSVTNTGNAIDTFTVTLSGNAYTSTAPAIVGPLAAGASTTLNVVVTIPAGAASGASDTVNVNVTSQGDPSKFATAALTTSVTTIVRGVSITPATTAQAGLPGRVVTYTLTVTNTGGASDTFVVTIAGNTFGATAPLTVGPLAAGASTLFEVTVTIPTGTPAGTTDTATVTVKSQGDNAITANANLTTSVWFGVYLPTVLK